MGARLRYAKVVDREQLSRSGGVLRPGMDNEVRLDGEAPTAAAPFVVMRAWDHVDGAFTETWRIEDPYGRTVHDPMTHEVVPPVVELADEIVECEFEYADRGYQLVLEIDGREVARANFVVTENSNQDEAIG